MSLFFATRMNHIFWKLRFAWFFQMTFWLNICFLFFRVWRWWQRERGSLARCPHNAKPLREIVERTNRGDSDFGTRTLCCWSGRRFWNFCLECLWCYWCLGRGMWKEGGGGEEPFGMVEWVRPLFEFTHHHPPTSHRWNVDNKISIFIIFFKKN